MPETNINERLDEIVRALADVEYREWARDHLLRQIFGFGYEKKQDVQEILGSFDDKFLENLGVIANRNWLRHLESEGSRNLPYQPPEGVLLVWQAGIGAYNHGDYQDALNLFKLAEDGYKKRLDNLNASLVNGWYTSASRKLPNSQQPVANIQ